MSRDQREYNIDKFQEQCEDTTRRTYKVNESIDESQNQKPRKKYGNNIVLYDGIFLVTLGPDYFCFLPTFMAFLISSFYMTQFILSNTENSYLTIATLIVCGLTPLSYLMVAISNPGIVTEENIKNEQENILQSEEEIKKTKLCRRCNFQVKKTTYHCGDCDVCVSQFDHHCPWTSKCIGGGNLKRFYFFLAMVPIFFVYMFISFAILMSQIAQKANKHPIQVLLCRFRTQLGIKIDLYIRRIKLD